MQTNPCAMTTTNRRKGSAPKKENWRMLGARLSSAALAAVFFMLGAAAQAAELPPGPNRELVARECQACHNLDAVVASNETRETWNILLELDDELRAARQPGGPRQDCRLSRNRAGTQARHRPVNGAAGEGCRGSNPALIVTGLGDATPSVSVNVTLDGCCDHRAMIANEDLHRDAAETTAQADALLFGRVSYVGGAGIDRRVRARGAAEACRPRADAARRTIKACGLEAGEPAGAPLRGGGDAV